MVKISFRFGNLYLILLPYLKYLNIENVKRKLLGTEKLGLKDWE